MIRNRELVPDSEKISILLKGFDELENLLNNIHTSNEVDISAHVQALENITTAAAAPEPVQEAGQTDPGGSPGRGVCRYCTQGRRKFQQVPLKEIETGKAEGKNIFLVEYDLISDIQQQSKKPLEVLNKPVKNRHRY